jgi:6-phosphogluconolactonase
LHLPDPSAGTSATDVSAPRPVSAYVAAGAAMTNYTLDDTTGELTRQGCLLLPARVQYAWPHASLPILYAACADRGGAAAEKPFYLCALLRDEAGNLGLHGDPVVLPERPIHLTTDISSRHVLVAFGGKPGLTVYETLADGSIGHEIPRAEPFKFGTKPHHVRMAPLDDRAVLVARGAKGFGKPAYVGSIGAKSKSSALSGPP